MEKMRVGTAGHFMQWLKDNYNNNIIITNSNYHIYYNNYINHLNKNKNKY